MGLYSEKTWSRTACICALAAAFQAIYLPWLAAERELFRQECIFAVEAMEFDPFSPLVTAHGVPEYNAFPVFPAVTSGIHRLTGAPVERVMRGISMLMLAAGAVLVYFAAASQRTPKAGFVAAAFYLTPLIAMEKAVEGNPATTGAFFLLAAQLVFFYYGIRKSNWNKAWIYSALLAASSFLACGFSMLLYFIAPMFFFRRPLSVKSKFRSPGFIVAVLLLAGIVTAWTLPFFLRTDGSVYDVWLESVLFYKKKYFLDIIEFPLLLPLRLLPWSLIAWLPFCVALQELDKTPIFSRYLRTLTFVILAIVWLFNDSESRDIFFLLGPLAIQTGITYELGTRRYGERIRKLLFAGEIFAAGLIVAFVTVQLAPERWLSLFISLKNSLAFRDALHFPFVVAVCCVLLTIILFLFRFCRKQQPLWIMLLLFSVACGIFYGGVMAPYRAQKREKRRIGNDLRKVLIQAGGKKLYKIGINDLYGELFYAGVDAVKIRSIGEIPGDEPVVFLIGTEFPGTADRSWSNLLPPEYTYNKHPLSLWKGVLRTNPE